MSEVSKQIVARLRAENARDLSDEEIERCLKGCVSPTKLISYAKKYRGLLRWYSMLAEKDGGAEQNTLGAFWRMVFYIFFAWWVNWIFTWTSN